MTGVQTCALPILLAVDDRKRGEYNDRLGHLVTVKLWRNDLGGYEDTMMFATIV